MTWVEALAADWPELNQLLDEALALPAAQRERWLQALPAASCAFVLCAIFSVSRM